MPPISRSASLHLELESRPESLVLVRGVLTGTAELVGLGAEVLDNLRTAVSEACSNVVLHAYDGEDGPILLDVEIAPEGIYATVRDRGHGIRAITSGGRMRVGLPLISALADRAQVLRAKGGGTEVRMVFATAGSTDLASKGSGDWPVAASPPVRLPATGAEVVAFLTPVDLLRTVLGRLLSAVAARVDFSIDRLAEIELVAEEICEHVTHCASTDGVGFSLLAHERDVELTIGPLRAGSGAPARECSTLGRLAGELSIEPFEQAEVLRIRLDTPSRVASATLGRSP